MRSAPRIGVELQLRQRYPLPTVAETPHIARGTDVTLILAGAAMLAVAALWWTRRTPDPRGGAIALAAFGAAMIVGGIAIIVYAHLTQRQYPNRRRR